MGVVGYGGVAKGPWMFRFVEVGRSMRCTAQVSPRDGLFVFYLLQWFGQQVKPYLGGHQRPERSGQARLDCEYDQNEAGQELSRRGVLRGRKL